MVVFISQAEKRLCKHTIISEKKQERIKARNKFGSEVKLDMTSNKLGIRKVRYRCKRKNTI